MNNSILTKDSIKIAVISTDENWFGLSYEKDIEFTKEGIKRKNYPNP